MCVTAFLLKTDLWRTVGLRLSCQPPSAPTGGNSPLVVGVSVTEKQCVWSHSSAKRSSHLPALNTLISKPMPHSLTPPRGSLVLLPAHSPELSTWCGPAERAQLEGQCLKQGSVRVHEELSHTAIPGISPVSYRLPFEVPPSHSSACTGSF